MVSLFRKRMEALRRDLAVVIGDLRGERLSPVVKRTPGLRATAVAGPSMSATAAAARPLVIRELRRETADATTIVLADPTGAPVRFVPGQFLTLLVTIDGETHRRAYSICSSLDEPGTVAVTSKRVAGGKVSNHLAERVAAGDVLSVLGPSGEFTLAPDPAARRSLVLIAGGSGVTPIMAIARAVLGHEPHSRVTLLYGNRSAADIIFAAELATLVARHGDRLVVRHTLDSDGARLDRATLAAELTAIAARTDDTTHYYVCGPAPVMAAARDELVARGVPAARCHEERFATAERRAVARIPQRLTVLRPDGPVDVMVGPDATLLDAGLAAGVPLAFSCAMGGCGACAVELRAGEVDLDEPNCLSPAERAAGRILACIARPCGPCTIAVPA